MTASEKVDEYIHKHDKWLVQLKKIRNIFGQTKLQEEIKWGSPTYTLNGKLVAGLAAFKNHYAIWFHQGVFLKDRQNKLINAQKGVTRGLRQWRFKEGDVIDEDLVLQYILEAIANCIDGKEIKPKRNKKEIAIPGLLIKAFDSDKDLKSAFDSLTPGRKREYANYIALAKREITKESRLHKIIPLIKSGVGLNDRYKSS